MKTTFKKGQILTYVRELAPDETIEILQVYPKGSKNANNESNFYLVKSSDFGEDELSESVLLEGLDLFHNLVLVPANVKKLLNKCTGDEDYKDLENLNNKIKLLGYEFEYYLDAQPYNLRKI